MYAREWWRVECLYIVQTSSVHIIWISGILLLYNSHFCFFGKWATFLCPLRGFRHTEHLHGTFWRVSQILVSVSSRSATKRMKIKVMNILFLLLTKANPPLLLCSGHITCKAQLTPFHIIMLMFPLIPIKIAKGQLKNIAGKMMIDPECCVSYLVWWGGTSSATFLFLPSFLWTAAAFVSLSSIVFIGKGVNSFSFPSASRKCSFVDFKNVWKISST